MSQNINELLGASMSKVREMVDAKTVVGTPIQAGEGTTLIPISKISFGMASSGSDIPTKTQSGACGGGAGCGVKIVPVPSSSFSASVCGCCPLRSRRVTPSSAWLSCSPCWSIKFQIWCRAERRRIPRFDTHDTSPGCEYCPG